MSAKITAASTPCRRTGWSVTSAVSSAERLISKNPCRSRSSPVLGQRAPRLPHEPHRRPLDWLAPRGADEQRIHAPTLAADGEGAARRPLGRLDARRAARGRARRGRGGARERRHRPLGRRDHARPATGSTSAATRSSGTASGCRCRRSRRASGRPCDAQIRAPIPPGRYRLALDLVAEHRAWFSELGSEMASPTVDVRPRAGDGRAELPGLGRARRRTGPSGSPPRTPRATPSSPARSRGTAASLHRRPRALAAVRARPRAACRASSTRCSARRCSTASSSSASPTSRACRRSPRRLPTDRAVDRTTAGSCSWPTRAAR